VSKTITSRGPPPARAPFCSECPTQRRRSRQTDRGYRNRTLAVVAARCSAAANSTLASASIERPCSAAWTRPQRSRLPAEDQTPPGSPRALTRPRTRARSSKRSSARSRSGISRAISFMLRRLRAALAANRACTSSGTRISKLPHRRMLLSSDYRPALITKPVPAQKRRPNSYTSRRGRTREGSWLASMMSTGAAESSTSTSDRSSGRRRHRRARSTCFSEPTQRDRAQLRQIGVEHVEVAIPVQQRGAVACHGRPGPRPARSGTDG
jgi:hypothetical protein